MKNTPVKEVMIPDPITVNIDENFSKVGVIFQEKNIRHLPIVNSFGVIMGVISQRDFYRITTPQKCQNGTYIYDMNELAKYMLKEHLTEKVVTLSPEDSLERAVELMAEKKVGCIPIINKEGQVVGILTAIDMLKLFLKVLRQE